MRKRARVLVAIDGPAGAGKSTVARLLADRLGFVLVDTGALYRCVALSASRRGVAEGDASAIADVAEDLARDGAIRLTPDARVLLSGEDVSQAIRTPQMSLDASSVSAIPRVREALLAMQRRAGEGGGVVLEGRDIGTVVFPDAEVKFFLTATTEERAERRFAELAKKGTDVTLDATKADVEARDRADTHRPIAPLKQAEDAILVDSSSRSIAEVVDMMVRVVEARELALGGGGSGES